MRQISLTSITLNYLPLPLFIHAATLIYWTYTGPLFVHNQKILSNGPPRYRGGAGKRP